MRGYCGNPYSVMSAKRCWLCAAATAAPHVRQRIRHSRHAGPHRQGTGGKAEVHVPVAPWGHEALCGGLGARTSVLTCRCDSATHAGRRAYWCFHRTISPSATCRHSHAPVRVRPTRTDENPPHKNAPCHVLRVLTFRWAPGPGTSTGASASRAASGSCVCAQVRGGWVGARTESRELSTEPHERNGS